MIALHFVQVPGSVYTGGQDASRSLIAYISDPIIDDKKVCKMIREVLL
jgi:hypothetical protein